MSENWRREQNIPEAALKDVDRRYWHRVHNTITQLQKKKKKERKKMPNSLCSSDSLQTEAWEEQVERLIDNRQVGFHTTLPTLIIKATI